MSRPPHVPPPRDGETPPRERSLARIAELAARLREAEVTPPDPFVWVERTEHRHTSWWAVGESGRHTVRAPERFGWAVGDYPWPAPVHHGADHLVSEVFVKPTFVDEEGRVLPLDAWHPNAVDNHLLTDEMCHEIALRMEEIVTTATTRHRRHSH